MIFLRNCWYMAGWSKELGTAKMLSRRLADQAILLFRDERGVAQAILDRCPHRFAPLHLGKLEAGRVRCAYHGLEFDGTGRCVHNPHDDRPLPPDACVRAFPLHETAGVIWAWMGEVERADSSLVPDFSCLDEHTHHVGFGYMHVNVNYTLETDNIMDLSHIEYLHPGTLGSSDVGETVTYVVQDGRTVWSKRLSANTLLPPFLEKVIGIAPGTYVDRALDVRWDPPASMLIYAYSTPSGAPASARRGRMVANIFSPETETSTHYWYAISYDRSDPRPDGAEMAQRATDELTRPFRDEDMPMVEAVAQSMEGADFWSLRPMILPGDAGAVRARRVLDKMIRDENRSPLDAADA